MKTRKDINHLNAGEWSPKVYNRIDHEKHASALRQGKNAISLVQGSVTKRKGFELIAPAKYDNRKCRPIRFRFSKDDTLMLEFGHEYVRFHVAGAQVREPAKTISSTTAANPVVATASSHGYSNGDEIYIDGLNEMTELNQRWVKVANVTTSTFEIQDRDGNDIDGSAWTPETTGGFAEKVYEIASVYTEDDLYNLDYAQKNDVMWFCDGSKPVQRLIRIALTNWTFSEWEYSFPAALDPNVESGKQLSVNATTGTGATMTATGHAPFVESHVGSYWVLRHFRESEEITAAGVTNAIKALGNLTLETSGKWSGTVVVYKAVVESPNLATYTAQEWVVVGSYTSNNGSGGDGKNFNVRFEQNDVSRYYFLGGDAVAAKATLRSEAALIEGAVKVIGYFSPTSVTVNVVEDLASTDRTEDWSEGAWSDVRGYPSCVAFFEKAIWFADTSAYPQGIWKSETDIYDSFKLGDSETSGLFIELDSKERNDIVWMIPGDKLMIGTSGNEWTLSGTDLNSVISPTNIVARRQENKGSKDIRPENVDDVIMYVQRGSNEKIRAMSFSLERDKFHGEDMMIFSDHLTQSGIVSLAYQSVPNPILWVCTNDGKLLSFTYERDQNVFAWNPHDTDGFFEGLETLYGAEDDEVWVTTRRTINGTTRRFVERMSGLYNPDSDGAAGLVCFLIDLSGSMQDKIDEAKIQAINLAYSMSERYDAVKFALYTFADVGNTIVQMSEFTNVGTVITLIDGLTAKNTGTENGFEAIVRISNELDWNTFAFADKHIVVITDEPSSNSETQANALAAVQAKKIRVSCGTNFGTTGPQHYKPIVDATGGATFSDMSDMVESIEAILSTIKAPNNQPIFLDCMVQRNARNSATVAGLWHLEGSDVSVWADGYVQRDLTVSGGQITLDGESILVYVGLPYETIIEPLQINADGNVGSSKGYTKILASVYADVYNTIGLKYSDDGINFRDVTFRTVAQDQTLPPQLTSEEVELMMNTGHSRDPKIVLKSSDPLPFTLAALVIHYDVTSS